MKDFRKLNVWHKAIVLIEQVYGTTRSFPAEEKYGLTAQMRRAAVSISVNISEGCCRKGDAEFARFLYMAMGSASEVDCCIEVGKRLGYLQPSGDQRLSPRITEIKKVLSSLIGKLNADR